MNKYLSRVTSSARGETFNPLIWPALISTFIFGVGLAAFGWTSAVDQSGLYLALASFHPLAPLVWGIMAVATILIGLTFLLFNIPPAGKASGLVGFMLWVYATFAWCMAGGWFIAAAVGFPNLWFWIWQYLSLSKFRREDEADMKSMEAYDAGKYDSSPASSRRRKRNRGVVKIKR